MPVDTLQSMFEDPSRGSKAMQNLPALSASTILASSSSSDTRIAQTWELYRAFIMISFERMSSFFWSSPVALVAPTCPYRPIPVVEVVVIVVVVVEVEENRYRIIIGNNNI